MWNRCWRALTQTWRLRCYGEQVHGRGGGHGRERQADHRPPRQRARGCAFERRRGRPAHRLRRLGSAALDTNPGWQSLGYAGGLTDGSTALVRFGARDYDPTVGRWTDRDPGGLTEHGSPYLYCSGSPIDRSDPDGHIPVDSDAPGLSDPDLFRNPLGFPSPYDWYKHTLAAGRIFCGTPDDWIGDDLFREGRRGRGRDGCSPYHSPHGFIDVDAIKVCGRWYRIKGLVCINGCNVIPLTDNSYVGPPTPLERDTWSRVFPDDAWGDGRSR